MCVQINISTFLFEKVQNNGTSSQVSNLESWKETPHNDSAKIQIYVAQGVEEIISLKSMDRCILQKSMEIVHHSNSIILYMMYTILH